MSTLAVDICVITRPVKVKGKYRSLLLAKYQNIIESPMISELSSP